MHGATKKILKLLSIDNIYQVSVTIIEMILCCVPGLTCVSYSVTHILPTQL